jgi:murein DD-endopeptidase / murein LD-carboxypeptidase
MKKLLTILFFCFALSELLAQEEIVQAEKIDSLVLEDTLYWADMCVHPDSCAYIPLYEEVKKWLKTRYRYAGNSSSGIDCSGLVKQLCSSSYNVKFEGGSKDIYTLVDSVSKEDLMEGDLVFFKIRGNRISHVGLYLKDGFFVHSSTKLGVIISHLDEPYYKKYYYSSGRIRPYN